MKRVNVLLSIGASLFAIVAYAQQPPPGSFQSYGNSASGESLPGQGYVHPMPSGGYIIQPPAGAPNDTHSNGGSAIPQNPSNTYQNSSGSSEQPEMPSGPGKSGNNN
jgi:hypothetical protein